uniref:Holocarboxylase synthetase n=1 Tax=Tetraodon nigroviridis TaxID=99883 RepID=H3CT43_TETNG
QVLRWSDYCLPLAYSPGPPFRAVAQTSLENFSVLGVAFIEDRLLLDHGLVPSKIVRMSPSVPAPRSVTAQLHFCLHCFPEKQNPFSDQMEGHGHHLHLSSCHECLELENSTILSVKYASVENIPDLPDDRSDLNSADEADADQNSGGFAGCKPPNVLVYTAGRQERFQAVSRLLSECINTENNIIYHLLPQQVLGDPWAENTRLLVLAEEEALTPQLQACFLTYLSKGGRVLGLASSLCPAGICLEDREGQDEQIRTLAFTREDSAELELHSLASGKVYVRDIQGGGEVELWGELKSDVLHQRDMVIVRVTHEEDGGEAVLCQVHLEISPDSRHLTSEGFNKLKVSNALRYEVLTEILTSLGISCGETQVPPLSPVHVLATDRDTKASFLEWLQTRVDENGLLTFPKASLRMVSSSGPRAASAWPQGQVALVVASDEPPKFAHFCFSTYCQNLKTELLGRTLLYAEAVTSTMDLLEGLTLHLPKDVGLVAIATQQTQGRGRGRNAWLSPAGGAMFTVGLRVDLGSRLGQRIPFLQHLAALAVVEAVRTLPGYEDIDLRVKWPNDIYYSNVIKLGGILVTSTLMGSTFHLLIGCGFNVSNSNPTVSINDLIQRHNLEHGGSLPPLRCEQLIARTLGCLEALIADFQRGGADAVLPAYYKRWLHSGTMVRLWSEDGLEAEVVGLDHNGFLQVYNKQQGVVSLEPDGNSFDMLKNLVVIKQH